MDFEQTVKEVIDELANKLIEYGIVISQSPYDELLTAHHAEIAKAEQAARVDELGTVMGAIYLEQSGSAGHVRGYVVERLAQLTQSKSNKGGVEDANN